MNSSFENLGIVKGRCYVIAEIAQAHDGSLGAAHAYIDAIAQAGADAVKFQTHIAKAESTLDEPWRVKFSRQDESRYDYWKRMEFSREQWVELSRHAQQQGLEFISSPFSIQAVELLDQIGMNLWKIASGEVYNPPLIDAVISTNKPVICSSGMSSYDDLDSLVEKFSQSEVNFALLQCSTAYPCPPQMWGLEQMSIMRSRYGCPVGYSDHSGTCYSGFAAASLGAQILELHVTFSKDSFGPDVPASITTGELKDLVRGIRMINTAQTSKVNKNEVAKDTAELRKMFGRSFALNEDQKAGYKLTDKDLVLKKPGAGITFAQKNKLLGKRLLTDKRADRLLKWEDVE